MALLAVSGLLYFHFFFGAGEESSGAPPAPEAAELAPTPAEPLESQPAQEEEEGGAPPLVQEAIPLPALEESDALIREMAGGLSARSELRAWLMAPDLVRRFVAGVANVADGESP